MTTALRLSPGTAVVGAVGSAPNHFLLPPGFVSATRVSPLFIAPLDRAR